MELSDSNIKKKNYISGLETLHFSAQDRKIKKYTARKFLIIQETKTTKINFMKWNFLAPKKILKIFFFKMSGPKKLNKTGESGCFLPVDFTGCLTIQSFNSFL